MKVLRWVVAAAVGCSVCLAQTKAAWQGTLASYPKQSAAEKVEILKALPGFGKDFYRVVEGLPEWAQFINRVRALMPEIDALMAELEKAKKEDLKPLVDQMGQLVGHINKEKSAANYAVQTLVDQLSQVLSAGLRDSDPLVKKAAETTLLDLSGWFDPEKNIYQNLCGNRSELADARDMMQGAISRIIRTEVRRKPNTLLPEILKDPRAFPSMLIAFAEAKNPLVRKTFVSLLDSDDEDQVKVGYFCVVAWPVPEALPKMARRAELEKDKFWSNGLGLSFLSYGQQGPRTFMARWSRLPKGSKEEALDLASELPCQATLNLVYTALGDKSSSVRVKAVETLNDLVDAEWDEEGCGPNPRDISEAAFYGVVNTLRRLALDRDPDVRSEAKQALEKLMDRQSPERQSH